MGSYRTKRGIEVPERAVRETFTRASGPGGQNVNTVATRVQIQITLNECTFPPAMAERLRSRWGDEIRVEDSSTRSQWRNRATALRRALELIDEAAQRPRSRVPTKATRSSVRRRLEDKARRSKTKELRQRNDEE